jgi:hypothetical protein
MITESAGGHMSQPIVYVDTSEVRPGRLEELKHAMNDLARFVQANEPQLFAYNVYFTDDGTRMSVLHINPDSASLERPMKAAGPKFPPIGQFIRLLSIDVYGRPDNRLVEGLRQKAKMLGSGTVRVHDLHAGFTDCLRLRFGSGTAHSAATASCAPRPGGVARSGNRTHV